MNRRVAAPPNPNARTGQTCMNCSEGIFYSVSVSHGSQWLHAETYRVRCRPKAKR